MQTAAADCYIIVDFDFCIVRVELSVSLFVWFLNSLNIFYNVLSVNVVHINFSSVADKSENC